MADTEGNLFNYEGKSWGYVVEKLGFRSPSSDQDEDEPGKTNREASSTRLKKDDMSIYGYCPRHEDFYLVVCNICNQSVKPQALKDHIVIRHNGACTSMKNTKPLAEKQLKTKKNSKLYPTAKILGKLDIHETFRDESDSLVDVPRHDFSDNDSLEFKSNQFNKGYELKDAKELPPICNNSSSNDSYMNIEEDLRPLMKLNAESKYIDNVLTRADASLSYLTPPVPPDIYSQHGGSHTNVMTPGGSVGSLTPNRRPSTPSMSPLLINAHSSTMGQPPLGRPTTPGIGQPLTPGLGQPMTPGRGPPTPGGMGPPTPGGMGPPTPGGLGPQTPGSLGGPTTPGGLGPSTPGGLGPPTPGRGPPTPNMGPCTPGIGPSTPVMVQQQSSGLIHTLGSGMSGSQIIAPQSPNVMQHNTVVALPGGSPYGSTMSPVTATLTYQSLPLNQSAGHSPMQYSPVATGYQGGISTRQINIGSLQTIPNQSGLQTLSLQPMPEVMTNVNPQVGIVCQDRMSNLSLNDQQVSVRNNHGRVMSTEEEEVNRISAMLMRETESMTVPQQVTAHDVIEAQGLAAGGIRRGPLVTNHIYTDQILPFIAATTSLPSTMVSYQHSVDVPQSSVPVPMNSDSINMATIKQLRDKLLETVSESDLNAVLNVTPDAPVIQGSSQCFIGENNLNNYNDNASINDQYINISHIGSHGNSSFKTENDNLPSVEQITNELLDVSYKVQDQQYPNSQVPMHSGGDMTESDELARAVGSITGISQESHTNNYTVLTSLLQQPTNSSSMQAVSLGHSNPEPTSKTNSSEGITVVFDSNPKNSHISSTSSIYNPSIPSVSGSTLNHVSSELVRSDLVSSSNHAQASSQKTIITRPYSQSSLQPTQISIKNVIQTNTLTKEQYDNLPHKLQQPSQRMVVNNQQVQFIDQQQSSGSTYVKQQQVKNPIMTIPTPMESPKSKKRRTQAKKNVPLKDRAYDPEIHCGVMDNARPCTRSLTCKSHSMTNRRAVLGRSKRFDELLSDHKTKGNLNKASKQADSSNFVQNSSPGASIVIGNQAMSSMSTSSMMGGQSPIIVRALSAALPDQSPSSHYYATDPTKKYFRSSPCHTYRQPVTPTHRDDLYVQECPKPISSCTYNSRKLGGFLATDHRGDNLRNAFFGCLRKPSPTPTTIDLNGLSCSPMPMSGGIPERYNNVKPLLARKLQAAVPCSPTAKDCNVGVMYNGQLLSGGGVGQTIAMKRPPTANDPTRSNALPAATKLPKAKKAKGNDGTVNYVSNLVQIDSNRNKNQFPMVAVSVQNGIATPHTITLGNVVAGVRNPTAQSIRIHQQLAMKEAQTDARIGEGTNIVLGSGMTAGGYVIADTLKPIKSDPNTSIRIDGSKLIAAAPKGNLVMSNASGAGISLVASSNSVVGNSNAPVLAQNLGHQGQYFFTTVSGNPNSQLLQPLRTCRMGKAPSVKLLGTNQATVSGTRQPIVLQQDKEPS